jgi:hypothetical protein
MFDRDSSGVEHVEADLGHQTTEAMCHAFAQHARRFRPDGATLEVNGFQELVAVLCGGDGGPRGTGQSE